jgi:hypothetical protein
MSNSPNHKNKNFSRWYLAGILVFVLSFFILVDNVKAATQWVVDPGTCNITDPTNFPGQNCSPNRMCGDSSGIAQCYNTASLLPPAVSATSNTLYSASYPNGGYIVNCYATADAAAPYCDNSGAFWCNRSNTCYTTQLRDTTCTANTWGTVTCGSCRTGYGDCNLDGGVCEVQFNVTNYPTGTNNHYGTTCSIGDVRCDTGYYDCDATGVAVGNGCEALRSGACTTGGGLAGTWSCSVNAGGSCTDGGSNYICTCIPPKQYFETGTKAQYGTSDPLLWGVQFGAGRLIQFGNSSNEELFIVNNDGSVELASITAPATTTNKLYNVAGSLYWNGVMIGAGASGDGWGLTGNAGTDPLTNFIGTTDAQPLVLKTNDIERMRIIANGNVGVGTDTPGSLFDVYSDTDQSILSVRASSGQDAIINMGGDVTGGGGLNFLMSDGGNNLFSVMANLNDVQMLADNGTNFRFGVLGHSDALVINNGDGYVGVGTGTPSALLDVSSSDVGLIAKFSDSNLPSGFGIGTDLWGGEAGFYDMESGQLIVGRSVSDPNLVMLGQAALFVDQTTKHVGIASGYMNPQFPLHIISDSGINTYFQMSDTSRGGVFIGNASVFSADEAGLYDIGSDYPLAVFDADNSIIHYGNNINVTLDNWKVAINKFGNSTANAYLEIVDPYPVPGIEPLLRLNSGTGVVDMFVVSSDPDGVVTAPRGSLAMDYANGELYINKDNASDWSLLGGAGIADNIYTADGSIGANRNVTINDGNYLRFRDEQEDQNYLYFLTDYTTNNNLRIGGYNNTEGGMNHYLEFKDNLNMHSEGGIEIDAPYNQIDIRSSNSILQLGGDNKFVDYRTLGNRRGLVYDDDYSADFVDRSLVDKAYVDGVVGFGGAMTLQDVADFSIATDGSVFADFGAVIFEDDGGIARWTADVDGAEVQIGEDGGSALRFQSAAGVGNPALIELRDTRGPGNAHGIEYADDYSADFTDRSLVDKAYVDSMSGGGLNIYNSDGALSDIRLVTITDGVELRFLDESNASNYLYLRTDYSNSGQLRLGGYNDSQGASGYIEFGDGLYIVANGVPIEMQGQQISLLGNNSNLTIGESNTFTDYRDAGSRHGLRYAFDYSSDFTARSLVDKAYVDSVLGGGSAVTEVLLTSTSSNGSFSAGGYVGYEAANYICEDQYPGSYFCRTDEIIQFIRINGSTGFTGLTAWIAEGPPGYTSNSNDCNGWTDNLDTKLGAFWQFTNPGGGMGWLTNCAVTKPLACCR